MTLDELRDLLEGVRDHGSYIVARCPAHDDQHASLSVGEGEDGKLLVQCHAGCETEDVMTALGRSMSDLFPDSGEAVYEYHDANGNYLYEKVREPGKHFVQRRRKPDGTYAYDLKGVEKTLYRLPEVLAAPVHRAVFVVEGEKDADAVWRNGGIGTTQGGVNDWRPELADLLAGRRVVVCQDNDAAGRKAAADIMLDLKGKAEKVWLREARVGKDISDHFAAGFGLDELIEPSLFKPLDFSKPIEQPPWIFEGFLARGDRALFVGEAKLGKSWATMALATAIANKRGEWLGRSVMAGRVLYFDEENPADVIYSRFTRLGHSAEHYGDLRVIAGGGLRLDKHPELLIQEALMFEPDLVVVDSLARVHSKNENDFSEMSEILNGVVRSLALETQAGVILIHHASRANKRQPRGSSDLEAAVDTVISVTGEPGAGEFWMSSIGRRSATAGRSIHIVIREIPGVGTRLEAA